MRYLVYIIVGLFVFCGSVTNANAQFWKKKNGATSTSNGKSRDAFAGKAKKGPNIYSSKPPRTKSKSKLYSHSISKKKLNKKRKQSTFSSKKGRYKIPSIKSKGKGTSSPNSSSGGRKKGKGRKKN